VVDDFANKGVFAADAFGFLGGAIGRNDQPRHVDRARAPQPFRDGLQLGELVLELSARTSARALQICGPSGISGRRVRQGVLVARPSPQVLPADCDLNSDGSLLNEASSVPA
jgi:hypothetical protein